MSEEDVSDAFQVSSISGVPFRGRAGGRGEAEPTSRRTRELQGSASYLSEDSFSAVQQIRRLPRGHTAIELRDMESETPKASVALPETLVRKLELDKPYVIRRMALADLATATWSRGLDLQQFKPVSLGGWPRNVKFQPTGEETSIQRELILMRLHCPWISGCSTQYESTGSVQTKVGFTLKLSGIGLGTGQQLTTTNSTVLTANETCRALIVPASLRAQAGEIWLGRRKLLNVLRVDIESIQSNRVIVRDLPKSTSADHPCGQSPDFTGRPSDTYGSWDLKGTSPATKPIEDSVSLGRSRTFNCSIGLPVTLFGLGLDLSFSAEVEFSDSVKLGCKLSGGHLYEHWFAVPQRNPLEIFWSAS